jgi:hypothetical protein
MREGFGASEMTKAADGVLAEVGACHKCGRHFITMPKDGIDHYADERDRGFMSKQVDISQIECGGKVERLDRASEMEKRDGGSSSLVRIARRMYKVR